MAFPVLDPRRIANITSLWFALLQFKHASPWVLSPTVISTPMRPESVCTPIITSREMWQLTRFHIRVPDYAPTDRHDLHWFQGSSVPFNPRLHYLQELDHYPDRLWRGSLVRWLRH